MATLVLNAVGTALGGALGGALGSLVGQSIDQQLFGPGLRKGPRLGDLAVQTSSYGSQIPRLYGTMRVAGTVVWATDLIEEESVEGGGKGSPEVLAYRYSASLAVALSSRPIRAVRRIWADGRLIRGVAGDWKVRTGFRVLPGGEDQPVDPLIASIETIDQTTAFRGLALAVFEHFELTEFGNRIPVLTFEVEADAAPVPIGALLRDASGGAIAATNELAVAGYAAHGPTIAAAIAPLVDVHGIRLREADGALVSPGGGDPLIIETRDLGCSATGSAVPAIERRRGPDAMAPAALAMAYYDPDRDYQAGQARASSGQRGSRDERIELPAAVPAKAAKAVVEEALTRRLASSDRVMLSLSPRFIGLHPGDRLRLPGSSMVWSIDETAIEAMALAVTASPATDAPSAYAADPGRAVRQEDRPIGRTSVTLIEPPPLGSDIAAAPRLFIAASNAGPWKPVSAEVLVNGAPIATTAVVRKSVTGTALSALVPGSAVLFDERTVAMIRLHDPLHSLRNANDRALAAGMNGAMIGDEMIQFGRAEAIGDGVVKLSRLLRGRRGSEWAMAGHGVGDPFCLIDAAALVPIDLPVDAIGAESAATTRGIADREPLPRAERIVGGEALRPPSPCHLRVVRDGGAVRIDWVRRSHRGWPWIDGGDVPADGYAERYRVTIEGPGGRTEFDTGQATATVDLLAVPAAAGQQIVISVMAFGTFAWSRPRRASFTR